MKYNFNVSTDIENFALCLTNELNNQKYPLKNAHILEAISKIHGYKDWNTYRYSIKKNNRSDFIQFVTDEFNSLNHQNEYDFSFLSDIKHFSYIFRKHFMNKNLSSLSFLDTLNLISLSMGCKNWNALKEVLYEREKRINNINLILNQDDSVNLYNNTEYLNNPFCFFIDLFNNMNVDGEILWWGRSLSILKNTLDALIDLKQKERKELNIHILKENMYLEKYIDLSKNQKIAPSIIDNIETYLMNYPGYIKDESIHDSMKEQHEFLLSLNFKLIDKYIYFG